MRDGEGNVIAEYDGLGNLVAEYVYGNNQLLAKINSDKTIDYYLNDHPAKAGQAPGSARTMTSSGWSASYYPFGEIASQTGSSAETRFDFTGQERDRGTGLLYFGARYYDPLIYRWISVDPLEKIYHSFSSYGYYKNNPLKNIDPDGRFPCGAVIGGALDITVQYAQSIKSGKSTLSLSGFGNFIIKPSSEGGLDITSTLTSAGMGLVGAGVSAKIGKLFTFTTAKDITTRAVLNGTSNIVIGAVGESIQTGTVTLERAIINGYLGAVGSVAGDAVKSLGTKIVYEDIIVLGGEATPSNMAGALLESLTPAKKVVTPTIQGIANATSNTLANSVVLFYTENEDKNKNE